MRSFELQTYRDGKWKMDSVFDDRKIAIEEGNRANESSRYSGVRVVEENFDEATNQTTSRTLFRGGAAKSEKSNETAAKPKRSTPRIGTGQGTVRTRGAKPKAKKSNFLVPVLVLLVVLLGGLVALFGLQHLASLK